AWRMLLPAASWCNEIGRKAGKNRESPRPDGVRGRGHGDNGGELSTPGVVTPARPGGRESVVRSALARNRPKRLDVEHKPREDSARERVAVGRGLEKILTFAPPAANGGIVWINRPILSDSKGLVVIALGDEVEGPGGVGEHLDDEFGRRVEAER